MSVSYGVKLIDPTITLSGKTLGANGQDNILVGQNCTPNLAVSGLPTGVYVGWPQWSISGNTYKRFDTGNSIGQSAGLATRYPDPADSLLPPPIVYTPPTFYWKDNGQLSGLGPETVSAMAALYSDPAGALSQNPVLPTSSYLGTVTATRTINVWLPDEYDTPAAGGVYVPNPILGTVGAENGAVTSGAANPTGNLIGYDLEVAVGTPILFTGGGAAFGNWAWLQLCQLNVTTGGGSGVNPKSETKD